MLWHLLRKNSYLISFSLKKGIRYSHPICIVSYGENDINKWEVLEFYVSRINQARTKFINCITPTKYVFMHLRISCIQITFRSLVYPYHFCSVEGLPNKNLRKQTYVMIRNLESLFIFSCIVKVYALLRHKKGFYGLMSITEVLQNSFKYQKHLPLQLDNLLWNFLCLFNFL